MTITFAKDNDIIVYALERVISYTRKCQQIFVAQCVWWLAGIIGIEGGLVIHIDNVHRRSIVRNKQNTKQARDPVTQNTPEIEDPEIQGSKENIRIQYLSSAKSI